MTTDVLSEFVISLERKLWNAVVEKNGAALGELLAGDYIEITVDGKRIEKSEIVELSPQVDEIDGYVIDSERAVALGENTTALSYHLILDGRSRGTTISPRDRWATSIWSQINDRWLCCFFQQSRFHPKGADSPWLSIPANEYDEHLAHPAVRQRPFLDRVFADALAEHKPRSVAMLGCATGGGLEYVDPDHCLRVTAVDINPEYLAVTRARLSDRLPQLELIQADLHTCELDAAAYDLVHCALVLEYVDPEIVFTKAARWLSARGVLVVVLQLPSEKVAAVTPTGCDSLKLLTRIMTLHEPEAIRQQAGQAALEERASTIERLETGKQFLVAHYCHVK